MPTFDEILEQVQRQEREDQQAMGQGPQIGLGGTFSGLGDMLRGIAQIKLAKRERDLTQKVQDTAQKEQDYRMKKQSDDLFLLGKQVEDQKRIDAFNKISQAHKKATVFKDPSFLSGVTQEDVELSRVLRDPLTGNFRTLGDEFQDLRENLKTYPKLLPFFDEQSQDLYTPDAAAKFRQNWERVFEFETKEDDLLKRSGSKKSGQDPMMGIDRLTKDTIATLNSINKVGQDFMASDEEKDSKRSLILNSYKSGTMQRARRIFEKSGANDQLAKLDQIEEQFDSMMTSPESATPQQTQGLFASLSNLFGSLSSGKDKSDQEALSSHPNSAVKTKTKETPITTSSQDSKEKVGKGSLQKRSGEPAVLFAKRLSSQGVPKDQARKILKENYPELE